MKETEIMETIETYMFTVKTLAGHMIMFESATPTLTKVQIVKQLVEMGEYTKHQGYYLSIYYYEYDNDNNQTIKDDYDNYDNEDHKYHYYNVLYTFVHQFPRIVIRYLNVKKEFLICHECMEKECAAKHCNYSILKLDQSEYIRRPVFEENTKTIKYMYDYLLLPYDDLKIDESSYDDNVNHIWFEWDENDGNRNNNDFEERCKELGFNFLLPRVPQNFGSVFKLLQFYEKEDNGCVCNDLRCPFYKGDKGDNREENENEKNDKNDKNIHQFITAFTSHMTHTPYVFQSSQIIENALYHLLRDDKDKEMTLSEWMSWVDYYVKIYKL